MEEMCIFCRLKDESKIISSNLAFVIEDSSPVTKLHSLIIPNRHFASFFDITNEELVEINSLIRQRKDQILAEDPTVEGFNIGINIGETAGQSVFHLHVHLIPRRAGDLENPKGGIRGVIPEKRNY
ncbi:HIT family protein [Candidatus Dependentiae bacterium]|nr:HIT family protein [Candidatus Dependentiae bacterium]